MKNLRSLWMFVAVIMLIGCGGVKANEDEIFAAAKQFQEQGKQREAVAKYEELVKIHPTGKRAPNAQFMIGFLYANEIKELDKAKAAYQKFLKDYSAVSDSGIIKSAQWELEHLGKDINDIEELKKLAPADTTKTAPVGK